MTLADFFNEPAVPEIDLPGYTGNAGEKIHIQADDDFEVTGVIVRFLDTNGAVLEQGFAARNGNGGSEWEYLATTTLSAGQSVTIEVTATDQPGQNHCRFIANTVITTETQEDLSRENNR